MYYFVASLIVAVLGAIPLVARKKIVLASLVGILGFLITWFIAWVGCPSTAWPLGGYFGFMTLLLLAVSAVIDGATSGRVSYGSHDGAVTWTSFLPLILLLTFIGSCVTGSNMLNADAYAKMVGQMETRVWTQDVQPKDPAHMRMANHENAIYQAQKVLGSAGAIGSQFNISEEHMTLQMVKGHLYFIVPLDYTGFSVWSKTDGVPGYIRVDGEDPHAQPETVMLSGEQKMIYTPGAFFGYNLERYLRNNGYLNTLLTDWTFEVDDSGKVWWVVTVAKPTIVWSGERVTGVVLLDPTTGANNFYPMGGIPTWVDRVVPASYVEMYLDWQGSYSSGWWNSWWGKTGLTTAEKPSLIYGTGDQPEFVTGITSTSGKDNSLVALVYTNSRTGKSVRYVMKGGATETAVLDAVDKNSQVQFKHQHGVDPQLYNINGSQVAVVPLLNESHAYQGVAMVPINDVQLVAVGSSQYEALRDLEGKVSEGGQRMAIEQQRDIQSVEGVVDRFASEIVSNGTIYYIHLKDVKHLFTAKAGESAKLPVTQVGDKVRLEFYSSGRDVVPTKSFDNLSIVLSSSPLQDNLKKVVRKERNKHEAKEDAATVLEELKKMSPEELQKLKGKIQK